MRQWTAPDPRIPSEKVGGVDPVDGVVLSIRNPMERPLIPTDDWVRDPFRSLPPKRSIV